MKEEIKQNYTWELKYFQKVKDGIKSKTEKENEEQKGEAASFKIRKRVIQVILETLGEGFDSQTEDKFADRDTATALYMVFTQIILFFRQNTYPTFGILFIYLFVVLSLFLHSITNLWQEKVLKITYFSNRISNLTIKFNRKL